MLNQYNFVDTDKNIITTSYTCLYQQST